MNWVKQNKGLSAYFLLILAGSGFLGFKMVGARSQMEESMEAFEGAAQELNRLRGLSPFPEKKNLEMVQAQQQELSSEVEKLRSELHANQLPLEPLTEVEFQDRLKETVERISASAAKAGVALPEKFYLGFDQYQAQPPKKDAAPHLARQLKAIEWVVNQLIANQVKSVERLSRDSLPEEGEKVRGSKGEKSEKPEKGIAERGPGRGGRGEVAPESGDGAKKEIVRTGFELGFRSTQASFQKTLNDVTGAKVQFYIPTRVEVRNEKEKGPVREGGQAVETAAAQPAGAPENTEGVAAAAKAKKEGGELRYIVGEELVVVDLRLDMVNFSDPKEGREESKKHGGRSK